jgi:co-chaperonin GroES (HSP10)
MIRAVTDKVFVRIDADEQKTSGGIWLGVPGTITRNQTLCGTVVSVGEGKVTKTGALVPSDLAPGARVMVDKGSGWEIQTTQARDLGVEIEPGQELIAVREELILCEVNQ